MSKTERLVAGLILIALALALSWQYTQIRLLNQSLSYIELHRAVREEIVPILNNQGRLLKGVNETLPKQALQLRKFQLDLQELQQEKGQEGGDVN